MKDKVMFASTCHVGAVDRLYAADTLSVHSPDWIFTIGSEELFACVSTFRSV